MSRVLTNNTVLRAALESSTIGTLPAEPLWRFVEFDTIGAYGAVITTVVRRPVSQLRGRKKGTVTDLDSSVEFETDLTVEAFQFFAEAFMFARFANHEFDLKDTYGAPSVVRPPTPTVTANTFDVDSISATLGAKMVFGAASSGTTLLFGSGYAEAANNGIHELANDAVSTDLVVTVTTALATEAAPPLNATLEVCGVRVSDADLTLAIPSGGTTTLTSAADIADWSVLGIQVGQLIHIGGVDSAGLLINAMQDVAADDVFGYARVTAIATNVMTLDKLGDAIAATVGAADNSGTGVADIMFGRFCRNVPVTAATIDSFYIEKTYTFEQTFVDLGGVGTPEYEYAVGNFVDEFTFNLPLTDKATVNFGMIGTTSDDITPTQNPDGTDTTPLRTTAFNTSTDFISITTDVTASASEVCFKSMTLAVLNNVSPEKCLGTLGATFMNAGIFEANLEGQMLFTNKSIVNAVRNNTTVTFGAILRNQDGAIGIDMPEMNLGDGGREYPVDQSVLVNITGASFTSNSFGFDISFSLFPVVPGVIAQTA